VSSGTLTIANADTDANNYYRALPTHTATGAVWVDVLSWQIETGSTTSVLEVASATMGCKVTLTITADSTITVAGSSSQTITETMTTAKDVRVLLTAGGFRVYVDAAGSVGTTFKVGGVGAAESTNDRVTWGKVSTTSDNNDQKTTGIRYCTADTVALSWPPNGWLAYEYATTKTVNQTWDGTVETVHGRDDRYISFTQNAISAADLATLAGYYTTHMAPGSTFYLAEDQTALATSFTPVKWLVKDFKPVKDAAIPTHYQLGWRLRVVAS
jgi:hypothetical protein